MIIAYNIRLIESSCRESLNDGKRYNIVSSRFLYRIDNCILYTYLLVLQEDNNGSYIVRVRVHDCTRGYNNTILVWTWIELGRGILLGYISLLRQRYAI